MADTVVTAAFRRATLVWVAVVAVTLVGCSTPKDPPAQPPPSTVTVTATPSTSASASAPASSAPVAHRTGPGSFRSPSGNILCAMFSHDGETRATCEAVEHEWAAPPRDAQCQLNWGSRLQLEQGGVATFACHAQELPAAQQTLGYGSTWSAGTITCSSEPAGITCADTTSGRRFEISRDAYRLG